MATKRSVNVTLDPDLYERAKLAGLNLSQLLAEKVKSRIHEIEMAKWQADNRVGLEELNRITEEHGLLSDDYRTF
ncbi:type II toxin-antitoxin system CcdA family antitoxin [Yersinia aleksiciae]|uniref:Antitoxin n=1 Tax=Yersinia aleksiciae TaxID=263819 RepID=A0A0T9U8Q7_YERAE|nr:type II toxin-antitoxin system CcdA family antitoxin [Yersinia aleksiciae]AKP33468.1 antitoxin [Yersinia aleksiciae]MDA5496128.1 type II toxin-antitoxin system CcdA family antitoxin [Yersinia aleksiciae]NIK99443.1 type II toxin-antitoxin system CcdA family antitoxin [Yersinia aleksiciae]WQC70531.1 type II toxin-antitoxin system CcdA family antitoxin [Yersinia aleksiciae]CFQ40101.1 gyrase inhibitor antitoxin [Yersinia aleksiciae]